MCRENASRFVLVFALVVLTAGGTASATNFTITADTCGTSTLAGSGATCTVTVKGNPTTAGGKTGSSSTCSTSITCTRCSSTTTSEPRRRTTF